MPQSRLDDVMPSKVSLLSRLLHNNELIRVAGAHDGASGKLVERNGFDAVWASGLAISTAYAVPDASILTMTEFLDAARIINEAVAIPVIADCDTGFGNAENVAHMCRRYQACGIAAVCIEDKPFPKTNSLIPGRSELEPLRDFLAKIHAAKQCPGAEGMLLIARMESLIAGRGQGEALRRSHASVEAGADAILIHSRQRTAEEILEFARAWRDRAPLAIIPTTYYKITTTTIARNGIRMVIYANHAIRAAVKAMNNVLADIMGAGTTQHIESHIASMTDIFELQGMIGAGQLPLDRIEATAVARGVPVIAREGARARRAN
jgi:phosphoenolpyruvate phosphomutase